MAAIEETPGTARTAVSTPHKRRSIWQQAWRKKHLYLLLLPMIVFLLTFCYYPAIQAIRYSFLRFDGTESEWIGLKNYPELFADPLLKQAAINTARLAVFNIIIHVWVPFFVAELLFHLKDKAKQYWYRVLFVIPMVVPYVAVLLIWQFIYEANHGILNALLRQVGLEGATQAWLGDPKIALYAIMFVGFPWVSPFSLLLYFAALQGISKDIIDASLVDGCKGLRRISAIDIPIVLGQIKVILILQIIGTLQGFVGVMILTNGGPGNSTMLPGLYMYRTGFYYFRFGYASAIGVVLFLAILGLTYLSMSVRRPATEYIHE